MDSVMDESTGGDRCDGCDNKTSSLLNVETKSTQVEHYTTIRSKELEEKDYLENNPSYAERYPLGQASPEQAQTIEGDGAYKHLGRPQVTAPHKLEVNIPTAKEPSSSVTKEENQGLKVGDKVKYVGEKYRESIGNQFIEVVKISVNWTGNQVTCSYDKGWTTWLKESSLKKVKPEKDHD